MAMLTELLLAVTVGVASSGARQTLVVSPEGPYRSIGAAVADAPAGARVVVRGGIYREPMIVIDKPLELAGEGWPVLDGEGRRQLISVNADDVTVRGLVLRNVGASMTEDRAAIAVAGAARCVIEDNRIEDGFFGIHLSRVRGCRIARNSLRGRGRGESDSGNGIHVWTGDSVTVAGNTITGHRDGIYFEFVRHSAVHDNRSAGNLRYGLHFMYSDECRYRRNIFSHNLAGVAVMYTRQVEMTGNRFEDNWGSASYGLLLKEIQQPVIVGNIFARNTVGLVADGATGIVARGNRFVRNGWAIRLQSSTYGGRFEDNDFAANTFDVTTNARHSDNEFEGNYFEDYRGYDLDRDGIGDLPHRPVRLFSVVLERNPPAMILLRSPIVGVLDLAERVMPVLTPVALMDPRPRMRPMPAAEEGR